MAKWNAQVYYKSSYVGAVSLQDEGVYASGIIDLTDQGRRIVESIWSCTTSDGDVDWSQIQDKDLAIDNHWAIFLDSHTVMHVLPDFSADGEMYVVFVTSKTVDDINSYLERLGYLPDTSSENFEMS